LGAPETIVAGITDGVHVTRDVLFSRDGKTLFVSVGSGRTFKKKGRNEVGKANILAFNPDGSAVACTPPDCVIGVDRTRSALERALVERERTRPARRQSSAGLRHARA